MYLNWKPGLTLNLPIFAFRISVLARWIVTGIQTKQAASRKFVRVLYFVFSILLLMRWYVSAVQANQTTSDNFPRVLCASGRSAEIPESADVYGWLVGSWELEVLHYAG